MIGRNRRPKHGPVRRPRRRYERAIAAMEFLEMMKNTDSPIPMQTIILVTNFHAVTQNKFASTLARNTVVAAWNEE
jgi:hypothetical protein